MWDKHRASSAGLRATSDGSSEVNALTLAAKSVYSTPSVKNAVVLMEGALQHESPIVKVAAAHAFLAISANPAGLVETLVSGLRDNDRLTREVAATALARFDPSHPALTGFIRPDGRDRPGFSPSHTSLIVHGTWARSEDWWPPRIGDFHTYIRTNVRPDVYSAADRYDWTGGYSDAARATAATELTNWVNAHQLERPTVFAHSHGGNVAMLASHSDLKMDTLVLLSCPAHIPKYSPNLANINKVVSVRVKMDLVILVDGGA